MIFGLGFTDLSIVLDDLSDFSKGQAMNVSIARQAYVIYNIQYTIYNSQYTIAYIVYCLFLLSFFFIVYYCTIVLSHVTT